MYNKIVKCILFFSAFLLVFSSLSFDIVRAQENNYSVTSSELDQEVDQMESNTQTFFNLLEKMPDDVADNGIDSAVQWLNANKSNEFKGYEFVNIDGSLKLDKISSNVGVQARGINWGACISAVGVAIASNAIPYAKILKVKKAAKAMGGMTRMTKSIMTAYKHQRNLGLSKTKALKKAVNISAKAHPPAVRSALIEFFSLGGLASCKP